MCPLTKDKNVVLTCLVVLCGRGEGEGDRGVVGIG